MLIPFFFFISSQTNLCFWTNLSRSYRNICFGHFRLRQFFMNKSFFLAFFTIFGSKTSFFGFSETARLLASLFFVFFSSFVWAWHGAANHARVWWLIGSTRHTRFYSIPLISPVSDDFRLRDFELIFQENLTFAPFSDCLFITVLETKIRMRILSWLANSFRMIEKKAASCEFFWKISF